MEKLEKYIKDKIISHFDKYHINIKDDELIKLIETVKSGTYAFQIIYDIDLDQVENRYSFNLAKPLNVNNVKLWEHAYGNIGNDLWSYDNGKTWKYNTSETLVFDLRVIRELKLDDIL